MKISVIPTDLSATSASSPARPPGKTLKIVVAYDGALASKRANRVLANLHRTLGPDVRLQPSPWKFDQLVSIGGRCRAIADATEADIIILSICRLTSVPESVNRWFETCLARKRGQAATVLALFDSDEVWTISLEGAVATAPIQPMPVSRTVPQSAPRRAPAARPFPFTRLSPRTAALHC